MPGEGKRAVVYNSQAFHITGVAMFSFVLMSLGFDVTAIIKVIACSRHIKTKPRSISLSVATMYSGGKTVV